MTSIARKPRRSRLVRALRAAFVACVSLWLLYVLGINLFLSTSLFDRVVNAEPETIDIRYRGGWSWIPGRIEARDLSIRGRDSNIEWLLKLDRADFDLSFLALTQKRFDVSRVHGTGISFRARNRLDTPPSTPLELAEAADLPPIDGLPPWSLRAANVDTSDRWSDAAYHLWTAHLENIVAEDVREVWVDRVRFEGEARIEGRFYLKPLRKVDVGPAAVAIRRGRVHVGPFPIADDVAGRVDATLAPLDPRIATTADVLHAISATTELHARCPDFGAVPYTLPGGTRVTGPIELRKLSLRVRSGVLLDGTRVDVALPAALVERGPHRLTSSLAATAEVMNGRFTSRAESTALAFAHEGRELVTARRATVTADATALDLAAPLSDLHVVVDLPDAYVPDAAGLSAFVPKGTAFAILEGSAHGTMTIEAWAAEKRAAGRFTVREDELVMRIAKLRIRGQTSAEGSFASYHWDTGRLEDTKLRLEVLKGSLASEALPQSPLVEVIGLRVDAHAPNLVTDDPLRTLEARVAIRDASIVESGLLAAYLPRGSDLHIRSGRGRFALDLDLDIVDHLAKGNADLRSTDLAFTFRDFVLTAAVRARARVHDWRWERGDLHLDDASVDVTNVALAKAGRRDFTIRRMLVTAKSPRFDLSDPLAEVTFTADIDAANVRDPEMINAFLPDDAPIRLDVEDGRFAAHATANVRRHVASAKIVASATDIGITDGKARLLGDMAVQAVVSDWDVAKSTMAVRGARVAFTKVKGRLSPDAPTQLSAKRVDVLAATPSLSIAKPTLRDLDVHLVVDSAEIPDARALRALLPEKGIFQIESGSARLSADVEIASTTARAKGGIELVLSDAAIALDETRFAGDFRLEAKVSQFDPQHGTLDLGGSRLAMRNVSVTRASTPTTRWSGDLLFDQASLTFGEAVVVDAGFRLEARDAAPIFALLFRAEMPGLLKGLVPTGHLSASGRVTADANGLFLDELDARSGDTRAHGSYASDRRERRGAFVVEKGSLGVGIRLDSGTTIRFWRLRNWLEDERKLVEKVRVDSSRKAKVR